jgi:hypothetical protein
MIQSNQLVAVVLLIAIFGAMLTINFLFDRRDVGSKLARGRIVTAAIIIFSVCLMVWFVVTLEAMGATIAIYFLGGAIALFGIVAVIRLIALQPKEDAILLDLNDAIDSNLIFFSCRAHFCVHLLRLFQRSAPNVFSRAYALHDSPDCIRPGTPCPQHLCDGSGALHSRWLA